MDSSIILNLLTFHFYYCEPSSKGGAILLDFTVVVAILGVACKNGYGGIRIWAALLGNAGTRYRSSPKVNATSRWIWRNLTMKMDYTANSKRTLWGSSSGLDGVMFWCSTCIVTSVIIIRKSKSLVLTFLLVHTTPASLAWWQLIAPTPAKCSQSLSLSSSPVQLTDVICTGPVPLPNDALVNGMGSGSIWRIDYIIYLLWCVCVCVWKVQLTEGVISSLSAHHQCIFLRPSIAAHRAPVPSHTHLNSTLLFIGSTHQANCSIGFALDCEN